MDCGEPIEIIDAMLFVFYAMVEICSGVMSQKREAIQAGVPRSTVYNALNQSELLSKADRESFHLEEEGPLHWKLLGSGETIYRLI